MDYTEAELEARIFPSVDLDPRDWEEEDLYIMEGSRDDELDSEPQEDDNALATWLEDGGNENDS